MKTLYLLRHAKSSWADPALKDYDRPLDPRGRDACRRMGTYLSRELPPPQLVLCSPARRTRETWERVAAETGWTPDLRHERSLYEASAEALEDRIRAIPATVDQAMLIGHNPALQALALRLAGRGPADALERLARKLPTGTLVEIALPAADWAGAARRSGELVRFVRPKSLPEPEATRRPRR